MTTESIWGGTTPIPVNQGGRELLTIADYATLRTYRGNETVLYVVDAQSAGFFNYDSTDVVSADNSGTIIVTVSGQRWKRIIYGPINVKWFGAKGDGVADDSASINTAIAAAAGSKLLFPNGTYKHTTPITITGIDTDFDGSMFDYTGVANNGFSVTLNSDAGAGLQGTCGNVFDNLTVSQSNFTEFNIVTGSAIYDPPSIATGAAISNIIPNALTTVVVVPGAVVGGFARATFTNIVEGIEITAKVTAPGVVTVSFSNYSFAPVDMLAGTIDVTVVNNAFHGLALGGSLGKLRNAKIKGFTGVSVGFGDGVDVTTGVTFGGNSRCFYWDVDINVTPAAGWGVVIPPRNNENSISLSMFAQNSYNEASGFRRCNTINQLVIGGITNRFRRLALEGSSAEETVLLINSCNACSAPEGGYIEYNTAFVVPAFPRIRSRLYSSANRFTFRHPYGGRGVDDRGQGNDIRAVLSFNVNGNQFQLPQASRNLVVNGDFENGINSWSDFSVGSVLSIIGSGVFRGKRVRLDIVAGRPNLSQSIELVSDINLSGLIGQNITAGVWLRSNIPGVFPRLNGITGNAGTSGDSIDEFVTVTTKILPSSATLQLTIITVNSNLTGFVEISNVTAVVGNNSLAFGERTVLSGTAAYNPPNLGAGLAQKTTVTVTGCLVGDQVIGVSHSQDGAAGADVITWSGKVTSVNTVTVWMKNNDAAPFDMANGTLGVLVRKA